MEQLIYPQKSDWPEIICRPAIENRKLRETVQHILTSVRHQGDVAVRRFSKEFDGVALNDFLVSDEEIKEGVGRTGKELKKAIASATENIQTFHESQQESVKRVETAPGIFCWRKSLPIEKLGFYIPGGSAPLFSSLLMMAVPAQIAGCLEMTLCTPPGKNGKVHEAILFTAHSLGLKKIYKIGGAQAIAAIAFGTETVPEVDKIFGPGNQYVSMAKQMVMEAGIAIDVMAGPSELAVFAGENCVPEYVAADLLSQAEHGADSQVVVVCLSKDVAASIMSQLEKQIAALPRQKLARAALSKSRLVIVKDADEAFDLLNAYAPEHLIIADENAELLADKVKHAGSVFLGNYTPESAGDYFSGTNHILPTNGYARAWPGLSLDSFVKKTTFQQMDREAFTRAAPSIEIMAAAEGLQAHKNAVSIRVRNQN